VFVDGLEKIVIISVAKQSSVYFTDYLIIGLAV